MTDERHVALHAALRWGMLQEAVHSVALSHENDCVCLACRAADGEHAALAEVLDLLSINDP